jgi:RHS repeat-associated protein
MTITFTYRPQSTTPSVSVGGSAKRCAFRYSSFFIHHSSLSFTFSAKEKDSETGLSYFGSRYYSSDLSIWLSVDPMSDKYASTSPYAYCRNNPIVLYDPNGMFDDWVMDKYGVIYWDENAKDQSTTKFGEHYLGRAGQRSYGTAVVNYKSDGTWSFMNPVEISSSNNTPANITANASSAMADVAGWVCGNGKRLNNIGFCTSAGGGMVNQAFETSETIGRTADELLSVRVMGKVAKTAKCFGFAGEAINIAVAFSNYTNDPTGYNFAKLIVTSTAAFSNGLNAVVPGLGTAVSIGISIIDVNGGFDWLYNKFK